MCLEWHGVSAESRGIADDTGRKPEATRSGTKVVNMGFKIRMKFRAFKTRRYQHETW